MFESITSQRGAQRFDPRSINLLATAMVLLFSAPALQAQVPDWNINCGQEGRTPCSFNDGLFSVYYNQGASNAGQTPPYWFTGRHCELAINFFQNANTCFNGKGSQDQGGIRHQILPTDTPIWTDFAMKQQRFGIQSDQAMNWITIFGTHNSYSNYQDGAFNTYAGINLNVDQFYSISDQLDAGARYIRLDPVSYNVLHGTDTDAQLRMCHRQSNIPQSSIAASCSLTSFGRLFAYGVDEVRQWLEGNPDEILVMRLNNTQSRDLTSIDLALENNMESRGDYILPPPGSKFGNFWDPTTQGWPTLRQMRAMNRRIIILSDNGTTNYTYPWSWVAADGYSDASGFASCGNTKGEDIRNRAFNLWSYIGEDRSGSNYKTVGMGPGPEGGVGLLGDSEVATATNCGFGIVNVDFLLAGKYAASEYPLGIKLYDYRQGIDDPYDQRREVAIWSWDVFDFGNQGPAILKTNDRWSSMLAANSLPFACAVGQGDPTNPVKYTWVISQTAGPWSAGPQVCQALGGKFWAPQSAIENQYLVAARNSQGSIENIWINYSAAASLILEPTSPQLEAGSVSNTFNINVTQGQFGAALSPVFQFTAGLGGVLTVAVQPAAPALFTSAPTPYDSKTKTISFVASPSAVDSNGNVSLSPGTYTQDFSVTERQGNQSTSQTFTINVLVTASVNVTVDSNIAGQHIFVDNSRFSAPHTFSWEVGSTHNLDTNSQFFLPGQKDTFLGWSNGATDHSIAYTVPNTDANIAAKFNIAYLLNLTTSGSGTITTQPSNTDGYYTSGSQVNIIAKPNIGYQFTAFTGALSGSNNNQVVTMSQQLSVGATFSPQSIRVSVRSQPSNAVIYVDDVPHTKTTEFTWLYGDTHTLAATNTDDGGGTHQAFTSWSIPGEPAKFSFTVPARDTIVTGNFNMSYLLSINATNGTLNPFPLTPDGYYLAGTPVTIGAKPLAKYFFAGFTGALSGTANPQIVTMSQPQTVGAIFSLDPVTTFSTSNDPLSIMVDGVSMQTPAQLTWTPGTPHTIGMSSPQAGGQGVQYVFVKWSDGVTTNSRSIVAGTSNAAYQLVTAKQFTVTATAIPAAGGTVSGGGWYTEGAQASLTATAAGGFAFSGFSGDVPATTSHDVFTVNSPANVVANFTAAQPQLSAKVTVIDDKSTSIVKLGLTFGNTGAGTAAGIRIASVTPTILSGTGTVIATTPVPLNFGNLAGGTTSLAQELDLTWPTSATRVGLTIKYTANGGVYQGAQTINLFR